MRSLLRILLGVVVAVIVVAVPLLIVQRAECRQGRGQYDYVWSITVPFQHDPDRGCRNPKTGADQLVNFVRGD